MWWSLFASAVVATLTAMRTNGDWPLFVEISRAMFGESGLSVYADHPEVQSGPIALLAVGTLSTGFLDNTWVHAAVFAALGCAAGGSILKLRRSRFGRDSGRVDVTALAAITSLMFWWSYLKACGHLDDAMVLAAAAVALLLVDRNRRLAAALVIGAAIAMKPWAVFLIPLTWQPAETGRRKISKPAISVATGALLWLPFVVADPGTLVSLRPTVRLAPDSILRLFGVGEGDLSAALRAGQLLGAMIVVAVLAARSRPVAGLLAGVAVRLMLDPATWSYYSPGLVVAAVAWDLCESRSRVPWMTALVSCLLAPTWVVESTDIRVLMRLGCCLAALAVAAWSSTGWFGAQRGRWVERSRASVGTYQGA